MMTRKQNGHGLRLAAAALTLLATPGPASAQMAEGPGSAFQRKGAQIVLLANMSDTSINNLLAVFKDRQGRCTLGPREIEIGFAPFTLFKNRVSGRSRYYNAERVAEALLAGGHVVSLTLHLSFHAKNTDLAAVHAAARDYRTRLFLRKYADRCNLALSPSLEDYLEDREIESWARSLERWISRDLLPKIAFRRSPDGRSRTALPSKGKFRAVQLELHGEITSSPNVYSNDGNLVYYPDGDEDQDSLREDNGAVNRRTPYRLEEFTAAADQSPNAFLLWRPAYNMLRKYRRSGSSGPWNYTRAGRDLSDGFGSFGQVEIRVLRSFLGIAP
jgi:hypothetical protein